MKILVLANSIESVGGGGPGGPVCNPEPPNKQSDGGSSQLVSSKEKHKGMTEIMATLILQLFSFCAKLTVLPTCCQFVVWVVNYSHEVSRQHFL